ncbi:MAG: hypothetical protein EOS78_22380 [Mesorhizobium sp.]|uniref:hypothetical protein n=1 Tax=unclassified Mesorhizobium TaxID=325217 RepID=UPI000F76574E|nr:MULTISPECIES: hypothetical protein [unclassified Mesorhizobium]AZO55750.1 hypothetical protein EJ077_21740 [Mesorhizobium sp. M8A.F.Ca.ET.057.01.1.1]RWE33432.1 MAG: hypothetical protein EOS78_22380 [Mesorhizobium sp.]RWE40714.1 MAG: hypothetical protein EOS80_30240 [Mesorhizobium sp.]
MFDNGKSGPQFFIPYSDADVADEGRRPIRPPAISYICDGIEHSDYVPGEDLEVRVRVANFAEFGRALVDVWLIRPSTGLSMAGRTPDLADLTVDIGPPGDPNTPKTIKARAKLTRLDYIAVDPLADRHQCLIVRVRSELDEPLFLEQAQPGVYRHWAQENLSYQPTPANEIQSIGFDAGNPIPEYLDFEIKASPPDDGVIERLIRRLDRGSYVDLDAEVSLGEFPKELTGKNALVVSLKEQEIRPLFLNFMLHSELKPNTFGVLQVLQRRMPTEKEKPDDPALIIGGIAVVVLPVK